VVLSKGGKTYCYFLGKGYPGSGVESTGPFPNFYKKNPAILILFKVKIKHLEQKSAILNRVPVIKRFSL